MIIRYFKPSRISHCQIQNWIWSFRSQFYQLETLQLEFSNIDGRRLEWKSSWKQIWPQKEWSFWTSKPIFTIYCCPMFEVQRPLNLLSSIFIETVVVGFSRPNDFNDPDLSIKEKIKGYFRSLKWVFNSNHWDFPQKYP